jgi:hypothetical protein
MTPKSEEDVIRLMLYQYTYAFSEVTSSAAAMNFFNLLKLELPQKLLVWMLVINYYSSINLVDKYKLFLAVGPILINGLNNENLKRIWNNINQIIVTTDTFRGQGNYSERNILNNLNQIEIDLRMEPDTQYKKTLEGFAMLWKLSLSTNVTDVDSLISTMIGHFSKTITLALQSGNDIETVSKYLT